MPLKIANDGVHGFEIHLRRPFEPGVLERELGNAVELARRAERRLERAFNGIGGKQIARRMARGLQAMLQIPPGIFEAE